MRIEYNIAQGQFRAVGELDEIVCAIVQFLNPFDLFVMMQTCKRFENFCKDKEMWKRFYKRYCVQDSIPDLSRFPVPGYISNFYKQYSDDSYLYSHEDFDTIFKYSREATCAACKEKIPKNHLRIGHRTTERGNYKVYHFYCGHEFISRRFNTPQRLYGSWEIERYPAHIRFVEDFFKERVKMRRDEKLEVSSAMAFVCDTCSVVPGHRAHCNQCNKDLCNSCFKSHKFCGRDFTFPLSKTYKCYRCSSTCEDINLYFSDQFQMQVCGYCLQAGDETNNGFRLIGKVLEGSPMRDSSPKFDMQAFVQKQLPPGTPANAQNMAIFWNCMASMIDFVPLTLRANPIVTHFYRPQVEPNVQEEVLQTEDGDMLPTAKRQRRWK